MKTNIHNSKITIKYSKKHTRVIEIGYSEDLQAEQRYVGLSVDGSQPLALKQSEFMALMNECGTLMQTPEFAKYMTRKEYHKDEDMQNKDMLIESTIE